jgi:hypothetical protein
VGGASHYPTQVNQIILPPKSAVPELL